MTEDLRKLPYKCIIKSGATTHDACKFLHENNIPFGIRIAYQGLNDYGFPMENGTMKFYFQKREQMHMFKLLFDKPNN